MTELHWWYMVDATESDELLEHVLEGWELELAAGGERDGEVSDDGEVDGEPDLELVVDVPVPAHVLHERDEEVVGHLGGDLQLGGVAGGDPAGVGHGAGRHNPCADDRFIQRSGMEGAEQSRKKE